MDIGSAAPDEQVENAVRMAVDIFFMCFHGFSLPMNLTVHGSMMKNWIMQAPRKSKNRFKNINFCNVIINRRMYCNFYNF